MATYFAGNVLPPTKKQTSPDDEDYTYRFTRKEAESLNLVGKPIRCEHSKSLECGVITKQMIDKTGKVYIIGKLHDSVDKKGKKNVVNMFADRALGDSKSGGKAYYPSLSLQHVHEESADGTVTRKRGLEVSLVHQPRRADCNIIGVSRVTKLAESKRHAASAKGTSAPKSVSENQDYIGDTINSDADRPSLDFNMASTESAKPEEPTEPAPAETAPTPVVTTKPVSQEESPPSNAASKDADGDFKMGDVVNVVLQQETELDRLKAQLQKVSAERDEHKTVNEARQKAEAEQVAAQKKSDTEKAQALLSTLTSLWDEQVPDAVWTENKDELSKKMEAFAQKEPELAKQLFSVVHSASSRYATVLNSESERERMLSSKLGHVMKKRKIHAASARSAEPVAPSQAAKAAPAGQKDPKDLMSIMKQYGNNVSGTAHTLMTRLYNQQMDRRRTPF